MISTVCGLASYMKYLKILPIRLSLLSEITLLVCFENIFDKSAHSLPRAVNFLVTSELKMTLNTIMHN